jgi:hypothetical protein
MYSTTSMTCEVCARALRSQYPFARSVTPTISPHEMRLVIPRWDADSATLQIICEDQLEFQTALSRSAFLRELRSVEQESCVRVPCVTRTWTAWLTNDPFRMRVDDLELMLDVIRVRSSYTLQPCMLAQITSCTQMIFEVYSRHQLHTLRLYISKVFCQTQMKIRWSTLTQGRL